MNRIATALIALAFSWSLGSAQPLTIYTEINPPSQFLGPDGMLTGFAVELVQEIQKRIGNTDPIQLVPWARGYNESLNKPNVVLFSTTRTEERDPLFQWVGPIREVRGHFCVRADSKIKVSSLEEAKALRLIGVYREDFREQYLTAHGFTNLDRSPNDTIIAKKLMDGRVDALVCNSDEVGRIMTGAGYKPEDVRPVFPFDKLQLYVAFSKTIPVEVVRRWADALHAMKMDGTFQRLSRKYYPHP
jgi:polar amino acid transport system substrate-binding protein